MLGIHVLFAVKELPVSPGFHPEALKLSPNVDYLSSSPVVRRPADGQNLRGHCKDAAQTVPQSLRHLSMPE